MCPPQPTLGAVCRGATLSLPSTLDPQLPSQRLLVPPPHPEQQEYSRGGRVPNYTYSYCQPLVGGGESFGLGYLQAAQQKEGEKIYSSMMGQATHAPCPPRDPRLKDHHEARQG